MSSVAPTHDGDATPSGARVVFGFTGDLEEPGHGFEGTQHELRVDAGAARFDPAQERAYERLFGDAMSGDLGVFTSRDAAEADGEVVDPVLADDAPCTSYEPRTWGPHAADARIDTDGPWRNPGAAAPLRRGHSERGDGIQHRPVRAEP